MSLKGLGMYFDIPVLVISAVASSFAVGSQHYLDQKMISATTCFAGILVTVITSVKLYLNIADTMMTEFQNSQAMYLLSIDIFKFLSLAPDDRGTDPVPYLESKYAEYTKLVESSELMRSRFKLEELAHLPSFEEMDATSDDTPPTPRRSYNNLDSNANEEV